MERIGEQFGKQEKERREFLEGLEKEIKRMFLEGELSDEEIDKLFKKLKEKRETEIPE